MPVYERGYTHWESSGRRAWPAFLVIAKRGILGPLKRRWMLLLLLMGWIPAIVKGGFIYVHLKAGDMIELLDGGWTSIDPEGFLAFVQKQWYFVFLIMAVVGSGLIANDRRDNGLSLYFSRPLGLVSYIGGKTLILLFYYCLVTLFPVYALCLFAYFIAPSATGMELLLLTPLRATVYCLLTGVSMSLVLLAFSSVAKRSIFVMVWWTILIFGTKTIAAIAQGLGESRLEAVNFLDQYHNAGALIFSASGNLSIAGGVSFLVILGWTAAALWLLWLRIRPVEVVS